MSKRIIVTAGSGFIGTNLFEILSNANNEVVNIDNNPPMNELHKSTLKRSWCIKYGAKNIYENYKLYTVAYT